MNVGYIRVSTITQNIERQLANVTLDRVFEDKVSAKDVDRPALKDALAFVREGDSLYIHSIDRLARNLMDLRKIIEMLNAKGVVVKFMKENLEFSGKADHMSMLMLNMLGCFAEFERNLMLDRQREGIAIAKAKGLYKGRKRCMTSEQILAAKQDIDLGIPLSRVARNYKVSRSSMQSYIRDLAAQSGE